MPDDDRTFFKALGGRIQARRKELGLTQAELGDELGCTQQLVALYEAGQRKVPVSWLPTLSELLGLSVDELLGTGAAAPKKRGPASRLEQQMALVAKLPRSKQRFVSQMIDTVLDGAR